MKIKIFLLSMLLVIPVFANQSLILVKNLGETKHSVPVVDVVDGINFLVLAEQKDIDLLKEKRFSINTLDDNISGKEYYLVYPFHYVPDENIRYSAKILGKYGEVLAEFNKCVLMQSTAEKLHSMTEYKVALDYIEWDVMDFDTKNNTIIVDKPTVYNSVIQSMLDDVSPDSVEYFERKLTGFTTRHEKSTCSRTEFIPWMKEIYKTYGCDTVVSVPIGNGSEEVIGIRYGIKDPTVQNFTFLGGHSDVIISGADVNTPHQGANDNTTGQVAVLEACRVHSKYKFDNTIIYCTFNAEETGLKGSAAACKWLKNVGAKVIGGGFSYDMFGMSKSNIAFSIYSGSEVTGSQEFCDKLNALKTQYNLTQPASIKLRSSMVNNTDVRNLWRNGYLSNWHNFATAGGGSIHSNKDVITSSYDKVFQAECAKLGIITTAEYAGVSPTEIKSKKNIFKSTHFNYLQTADNVIFTFNGQNKLQAGKLDIFNLKGKLIKSFKTNISKSKIIWDGTNNNGVKVAAHSVMVVKYSDPSATSSFKMIMK